MKVLLICSENDIEGSTLLKAFLGKYQASVETLVVQSHNSAGGDVRKQFAAFFQPPGMEGKSKKVTDAPTHLLVSSPIAQRWLDFLAGFSYGSHLPLLVYGKDTTAAVPVEFASFFRLFKTEKSLGEYLEAESEAFKKWESAHEVIKARDTLLQMGIPINGEALASCVAESGIREVSLFLAAGFSPDTRNKLGVPLLSIAARNGNREILKLLIMAGAQVDLQADDRGASALFDSVQSKQHDIIDDLIRAGATIDIKSKDGQTPLVVAVGAGDERAAAALVEAGADPDITDKMGGSARQYATLFRKTKILALFDAKASGKVSTNGG